MRDNLWNAYSSMLLSVLTRYSFPLGLSSLYKVIGDTSVLKYFIEWPEYSACHGVSGQISVTQTFNITVDKNIFCKPGLERVCASGVEQSTVHDLRDCFETFKSLHENIFIWYTFKAFMMTSWPIG